MQQMDMAVSYDGDFELQASVKLSLLKFAAVPIIVKDITFSGKVHTATPTFKLVCMCEN